MTAQIPDPETSFEVDIVRVPSCRWHEQKGLIERGIPDFIFSSFNRNLLPWKLSSTEGLKASPELLCFVVC